MGPAEFDDGESVYSAESTNTNGSTIDRVDGYMDDLKADTLQAIQNIPSNIDFNTTGVKLTRASVISDRGCDTDSIASNHRKNRSGVGVGKLSCKKSNGQKILALLIRNMEIHFADKLFGP